jgi:hypothetical protein
MLGNITPKSYDPIIQHLEDAADGAHTYGAAVRLAHNDEPDIRADLNALIGIPAGPDGVPPAVPGLKTLWNNAQANKTAKTAALRTACSNARLFARTCLRSLMPVLGESWNTLWKNAGFTSGSLAVPANPLTLLQQLRDFYGANPARETTVQGVACTAAACEAAAKTITAAETASNQSNTDSGTAYTNYLNGIAAGRARLIGLRTELEQLLDDDDDRWYAFGFEKPSDPHTPEVPANLTVVAGAPGSHAVTADWDDARRADNYRLRAVLKSDGSEVANEITAESQLSLVLATLAAGTVVVLTVTARDAAGESQPSNAVEIAVP